MSDWDDFEDEGPSKSELKRQVRALQATRWKRLQFELEWGYQPGTEASDYSGWIEVYDGAVADLTPLVDDAGTRLTGRRTWASPGGTWCTCPRARERACHGGFPARSGNGCARCATLATSGRFSGCCPAWKHIMLTDAPRGIRNTLISCKNGRTGARKACGTA